MDKATRRIKEEISVVMNNKNAMERRNFINEIDAYMYIENRKISDIEFEKSIKGNQHVYKKR